MRASEQRLSDAIAKANGPEEAAKLARLELEVGRLRDTVLSDLAWRFDDDDTRWWHAQLTRLVLEIESFADPVSGLVSGCSPEHGWGVERRLETARHVGKASRSGEEARRAWSEARSAILAHPEYHGLDLPQQRGLLPLGPDPTSGLWEFAHVASGELPTRDADGRLRVSAGTCLVLVLLPGDSFHLGAQSEDEGALNFDLAAESDEQPVEPVTLAPFFLSKYELTQGQWERFTDARPSQFSIGRSTLDATITGAHPVENVTWLECERTLGWFGLTLPTEAQWEYAARARTHTPWYTGPLREDLRGAENLADQAAARAGYEWPEIADWPDLDDGHAVHAPVGTYSANAFGLYDVLGNVREWCLDVYLSNAYLFPVRPGSGERMASGPRMRVSRGGQHADTAQKARVSYRIPYLPEFRYHTIGVRPARAVTGADH